AFDRNNNGTVDAAEWQAVLGDIGPEGEGTKRYIFNRVDKLADSDGKLSAEDLATAVQLARDILLGGGPSSGLTSGGF
ncbi:hypothetical protein MNEG_11350, partial [Monoraphidium neglectum]